MAAPDANTSYRSIPPNGADRSSTPLADVIICCTSVPDEKRTEIAAHAEQMGAIHRYDLTLDVTHLIVGSYDTPKYTYVAKERPDVRPMTIDWIDAVRELWINDQEVDFAVLEREHALPVFQSLKFSMTGCDDPAERLEIAETVKANGAKYEGDLTKQITHLISFRTDGAKYKAAKSWGLRIVSIEWLRDSLERGMILDEKLYDPALPPSERGKGAWDRTKPKRTSLGKRLRDDGLDLGKRKLRRTASTKLNSQNEKLWGEIVGGGLVSQVARSGIWEKNDDGTLPRESQLRPKMATEEIHAAPLQLAAKSKSVQSGIFSGCRFYVYGFPPMQTQKVREHLIVRDAEVSSTVDDLVASSQHSPSIRLFRMVPHDLPVSQHPELPDSQVQVDTVTEWWLERCLHGKILFRPSEHVIGRPFPVFPIAGFAGMTICSSAFAGIDLRHFVMAVKLIGATYSEEMTPQSTVLVTKSLIGLRKDKFNHAQEWNVPIVTADWVWDSITGSTRLPFQKYRCRSQRRSDSLVNVKGKPSAKPRPLAELSMSEFRNPPSESSSHTSKSQGVVLLQDTRLDETAFHPDVQAINGEIKSQNIPPAAGSSDTTTQEHSYKTEPLSERNANSPTRTVSTAPTPRAPDDISDAISNLLAKTKNATDQPAHTEPQEVRKRGANRILGRVTSNISAASTSRSRATSVDSTATHGHPVQYPAYTKPENGPDQTANQRIEMLLHGDKNLTNVDNQPPATQLTYDDPESTEARAQMVARMMGEKLDTRRPGLKEKAVTLSDLVNKPRNTRRNGRGSISTSTFR